MDNELNNCKQLKCYLQSDVMAKRFPTKSTSVWAGIGVASHMNRQRIWSSKCSAAYSTYMRSNIIVMFGMVAHLWLCLEAIEKYNF